MFPKAPINRAMCIREILRKNVNDAYTLWKRLYIKGFQRWETLVIKDRCAIFMLKFSF